MGEAMREKMKKSKTLKWKKKTKKKKKKKPKNPKKPKKPKTPKKKKLKKQCQDVIAHCNVHKKNGGCSTANPQHHMWRTNCVKTCGYCNDRRYNGAMKKQCQDVIA